MNFKIDVLDDGSIIVSYDLWYRDSGGEWLYKERRECMRSEAEISSLFDEAMLSFVASQKELKLWEID